MKLGTAAGPDYITSEMIKTGSEALSPLLKKLFNRIMIDGTYPEAWADGIIVPLYKKGDPSNPGNYRGITLSSCIEKKTQENIRGKLA